MEDGGSLSFGGFCTIESMLSVFRSGEFEGPLDLLLQLVESEKLDISTLSLATVADQFLTYVHETKEIPMGELADFLVVAAKLVYLKSRLLLPTLSDQEMDEGPDLETQLRRYKAFVEASKELNHMWLSGSVAFARDPSARTVLRVAGFSPPPNISSNLLQEMMTRVIQRLEPIVKLPQAAIERMVTIQEKMRHLYDRIRNIAKTSFHEFVGHGATKTEKLVSFLALLELVKQRYVKVSQADLFHDIDIESNPDRPASDPLAESFV